MKPSLSLFLAGVTAAALVASGPETGFALASAGKPLAVTKPVMACAELAKFGLTSLGGAGSKVVAARDELVNTITMCGVDITLATAISIKLPKESCEQRYMQLGCGGPCGNVMKP